MSNATIPTKFFRTGETAVLNVFATLGIDEATGDPIKFFMGSERVEVVGKGDPGIVIVRPQHNEFEMNVNIKNLRKDVGQAVGIDIEG